MIHANYKPITKDRLWKLKELFTTNTLIQSSLSLWEKSRNQQEPHVFLQFFFIFSLVLHWPFFFFQLHVWSLQVLVHASAAATTKLGSKLIENILELSN